MNVHRLQDVRQPETDRRLQPNDQRQEMQQNEGFPWQGFAMPISEQNIKYAEQKRVLFISGARQLKPPREENYWDMLVTAFCPTWKCLSITMLIILADTAMFIGESIYGIKKQGVLLEISINSLIKFGANNASLVASRQVYRLLSAIFVHISFSHFIGNVFSTFILITRIEHTFGSLQTLGLYLICGIGGNIFSITVDTNDFIDQYKAGASTALYGSIGIILGYLIINWVGLRSVGGQMRCNIMCVFLFLLIFVIIFTPSSKNVDFYGHLGGFLTGIWVTGFLESLIFQTREKIISRIFILCFFVQFVTLFLVFFLTNKL